MLKARGLTLVATIVLARLLTPTEFGLVALALVFVTFAEYLTDLGVAQALVYFVNSIGLNLMVEALRRETRVQMIELLSTAVRTVRGKLSGAEAGVIAVALVSLLETSIASLLNQDAAFRGLGARKFNAQVAAIGERIAGLVPSA